MLGLRKNLLNVKCLLYLITYEIEYPKKFHMNEELDKDKRDIKVEREKTANNAYSIISNVKLSVLRL